MWSSSTGKRTITTYYSDGTGPPRSETKTYTFGGTDGGPSIGFGGGNVDIGFGSSFGGRGAQFSYGGGGDSGGSSGFRLPGGIGFEGFTSGGGGGGGGGSSGGGGYRRRCTRDTQPDIIGRPSRKEKKNPFSGVKNQSHADIVKKCQEEGFLFEDPEFLAEDGSIFFSRLPPRPFEWKRPSEICDNPEFISEGATRFDVQQGELGDCWLLAAVASLTCNPKLLHKVVPRDQNFTDGYSGVFKFNIWHQGEWVEVVVDDRLPTYCGQLVFMHSTEKNEFWSALLEKAYAKLCGSYESLKGGSTSEAMEDFTGGVTEMFDLKKAPPNLLKIMLKAYERDALLGCSIDPEGSALESELENGLIVGHAYSVTAIKLVDINTPRMSGKMPMVRIRNPWGNEAEWKGAWSDKSPEWQYIPEEEKQEIGLTFDDDGEFWMSYKDFSMNYHKLEICNLGPDSLDDEDLGDKKKWEMSKHDAEWVRRVNAGGCRNFLNTFWTNPQFRVTLTDPDEDDEDEECTMIVALLQKDRRKKRKEGLDLLTIGYVIYKLTDENQGPLDENFFKYNSSCAKSPTFINMREVCGRHKLPPGTYAIVPSTFEPQNEGNFLLRIFTEKPNDTGILDQRTGYSDNVRRQYGGAAPQSQRPMQSSVARRIEAPPPTDEEQQQEDALKQSFKRISGEDMEIDAYELRDILNSVFTRDGFLEFAFPGFSMDTVRSMVAMHDGDLSGKLGYDEFKSLWVDLRRWKGVFKQFDRDQSGNLSSFELRSALNSVGFHVSNQTLRSLVMRYSNKEGQIEFGDFIMCAVRLKTMLSSFKSADVQGQGVAAFDIESFTQITMYS
ncbi:calpain-A-like isoform X3 [Gigantopelta aegis]|uniref:calpain-A-like isoform X3 n=1 Tax=Gigantopelta aegis TaxID=1735272 RepID=UPI001B889BF2|nr:calpain-A-like isoform X3 [Gigantopelta aegis]